MRKCLKILSLAVLLLGFGTVARADWEAGVAAFKAGQFAKASQEFRAVVEAQPEFAGGQFMLGQSLLKEGKKQEALASLRKAYELEPNNVSHAFVLGKAYLDNGRYNEALTMLNKVDPASLPKAQQSAHQQMKAVALAKSGRSDEALGALRQVAQSQPNSAPAWYSYGSAALAAGEVDAAVTALGKAVQLDPNDAKKKEIYVNALVQKARTTQGNAKDGVYAKAVPVAQALAADNSFNHLLLLGEVQLGAGQYREAVASLNKAKAKNAGDFYPHFYLAQAYTSLSSWPQAEASAREALNLAKQDRVKKLAWRQIGFINEKLKQYDEAIAAYRNAGDAGGVRRVEENQRIASENAEIDQHNQEIEELRRQEEELQEALEELEGRPPRR